MLLLFAGAPGLLGLAEVSADPFLNSREPGCNGSDPNVLWCDDFERTAWAETANDPTRATNFGWEISLAGGANGALPSGSIVCGGAGVRGGCAASGGLETGDGQSPIAGFHDVGSAPVNEFYLRYYRKMLPGYQFGYQKLLAINPWGHHAGAVWGNTNFETTPCPQSTNENVRTTVYGDSGGSGANYYYGIALDSGNWWFFEYHVVINTPGTANGTFQVWADSCGPNGTSCPTKPTLRVNRVGNTMWRGAGDNRTCCSIFLENWKPAADGTACPSRGTELYDQIKASRVGPIGFFGGTTTASDPAPAAPGTLTVR
jgi:hypothetical protein